MGATFEQAIEVTLRFEGGFSNDPADHGGATNWGITRDEVTQYLGHPARVADVEGLAREEAIQIYHARYWDRCRCGELEDQALATKVFDVSVNCGLRYAARMLQESVNACSASIRLCVDGVIGPTTIAAANALDPKRLVAECCRLQRGHYLAIVAANPTQKKFLKGWLRRADWPEVSL